MPVIVANIFWNWALPWLLNELVAGGVMEAEKVTGIKTVAQLVTQLKTLKTYQQYPTGKNGT